MAQILSGLTVTLILSAPVMTLLNGAAQVASEEIQRCYASRRD
jgi:hypothetical protein